MVDYNPFAEDTLNNPASAYGHLLLEKPVHYFADYDPPFFTLTRHADLEAALRDIELFSSEFGQGPRFTPPNGMLSDPPQHTFFRRLVQQAFTPGAIRALGARIEALAEELLDAVEGRDAFDIHDDYGFPLPVVIIAELLGAPSEDIQQFKKWSTARSRPWVRPIRRPGSPTWKRWAITCCARSRCGARRRTRPTI